MLPTAVCLSAALASIYITPDGIMPRPAPIPARWQLKFAPSDMADLPSRFFTATWWRDYDPRFGDGWYETFQFGRDELARPGNALVIRESLRATRGRRVTVRDLSLAVYGPLVEFDGRLYTVAITGWERAMGDPTPVAYFRAAVEIRKNVWYQAECLEPGSDGRSEVHECRMDFADDPRVHGEGRVTVRFSRRLTDEAQGLVVEADARFKLRVNPKKVNRPRRVVINSLPKGRAYVLSLGTHEVPPFIMDTPSSLNFLRAKDRLP